MTAPVLLTRDDVLREQLQRLAAAGGVALEVSADVDAALRGWLPADLVLVGADLAGEVARLRPPRRPGVHVVGTDEIPHEVFVHALHLGAEDVSQLPVSEPWLVEILTDSLDGRGGTAPVVAVVGGSGGVGASVLAAAVAATWGGSGRCLLLDADPCGAGVERVLGMERLDGSRWSTVSSVTGRMSGRSLRESLPSRGGVAVLGWGREPRTPLQPFAVREVLSAGRRGHDAVVVDLPRRPDPAGEEVLARADHVVLLSGSTAAAVTAASHVLPRLAQLSARPHLVVRAGGGLAPAEVASALGLPLAAVTQRQRGLEEAIDLGAGPLHARRGSVARAARDLVAVLWHASSLAA